MGYVTLIMPHLGVICLSLACTGHVTPAYQIRGVCIFGLHGAMHIKFFLLTSFSLPFNELSLVGLAFDMAD